MYCIYSIYIYVEVGRCDHFHWKWILVFANSLLYCVGRFSPILGSFSDSSDIQTGSCSFNSAIAGSKLNSISTAASSLCTRKPTKNCCPKIGSLCPSTICDSLPPDLQDFVYGILVNTPILGPRTEIKLFQK